MLAVDRLAVAAMPLATGFAIHARWKTRGFLWERHCRDGVAKALQ
jgi:hypothetical protein